MQPLFPDVRFCPTGGISDENVRSYLEIENVFAAGGVYLAPRDLIESEQWGMIERQSASVGPSRGGIVPAPALTLCNSHSRDTILQATASAIPSRFRSARASDQPCSSPDRHAEWHLEIAEEACDLRRRSTAKLNHSSLYGIVHRELA